MRLAQFIGALERLGNGVVQPVAEVLAVDVRELVQAGFAGEMDPYGIPWAYRKREYSHPILDKSGRMKSTITVTATPLGVHAEAPAEYAGYHQYGTRYMVPRRIFPTATRGLGTWRERLDASFQAVASRLVKAAA